MEENDLINVCQDHFAPRKSLKRIIIQDDESDEDKAVKQRKYNTMDKIIEIVLEEPSDDMEIGESINFRLDLINKILNGLNK